MVGDSIDEDELFKLTLSGEVIPNVCEKPIKFLGRWIRADATDSEVTEQAKKDLNQFLKRSDESNLTGLQKCWGHVGLLGWCPWFQSPTMMKSAIILS